MIDIHSYSELVLYPWGDDENQTTDPNQNFRTRPSMVSAESSAAATRSTSPPATCMITSSWRSAIRDGIAAVRGRVYTAQQSIALYPTTATTHDYAYARHFVDTGRRRILGFTLETAREFQPADAREGQVIEEVSAGLMECLVETMCPADALASLLDATFPLSAMRAFRDQTMRGIASGKRYESMLSEHAFELIGLATGNEDVRAAGETLLRTAARLTERDAEKIAAGDLKAVKQALGVFKKHGKELQASIARAGRDIAKLEGLTLHGAFLAIDERPTRTKKAALKAGAESRKPNPPRAPRQEIIPARWAY